jgi:uroporphyrinogen decarboxylase
LPCTWNRWPYHIRLNHAIHQFEGVKVIYHTDSAAMSLVDGLIAIGIDVLPVLFCGGQALQFSAVDTEPRELKRRFGDRLCFEGGVGMQTTLPSGTVEDVRQEVRTLITILGEEVGYILGPSHAIQAGTPAKDIVAMFDTAACFSPF